jgi:hypothetical protein
MISEGPMMGISVSAWFGRTVPSSDIVRVEHPEP